MESAQEIVGWVYSLFFKLSFNSFEKVLKDTTLDVKEVPIQIRKRSTLKYGVLLLGS